MPIPSHRGHGTRPFPEHALHRVAGMVLGAFASRRMSSMVFHPDSHRSRFLSSLTGTCSTRRSFRGPHAPASSAVAFLAFVPRLPMHRKCLHLPSIAFIDVHWDPTSFDSKTLFLRRKPPLGRVPRPQQTSQSMRPVASQRRQGRGSLSSTPGFRLSQKAPRLPFVSRFFASCRQVTAPKPRNASAACGGARANGRRNRCPPPAMSMSRTPQASAKQRTDSHPAWPGRAKMLPRL